MQFKIKITKAKRDLEVDFDALPDAVKIYIVEQGLGKLLNGATAKETAATTPDEAVRGENAYALAQKKLESLQAGKIAARKASDGKVAGVVMTEARRLAKNIVKQQIKASGGKISDYEAKAITEAANLYLSQHKELIATAEASIEQAKALAAQPGVDVTAIPVDPKKVEAREAANAAKRAATAAKNAGKPGGQASTLKKAASKPVPTRKAPAAQPQASA